MQVLVLVVLLAAAFWFQHLVDTRQIRESAQSKRWSVSAITWAPLERLFRGSRFERCYWLRYELADGRAERRLCRVRGFLGLGAMLEFAPNAQPVRLDARASASPLAGLSRFQSIAVFFGIGAFAGCALGIAVCIVFFPPSNILPAYGVIFGAPAGATVGAILGALRKL